MKRIAFLVTLFALFAQFTWGQDTIRIMTINIHQGSDTTLQRLGEVIREYHPDFVAVQEVDMYPNRSEAELARNKNFIAELSYFSDMQGVFGKAWDHPGGWDYGDAILTKHSFSKSECSILTHYGNTEPRQLLLIHTKVKGHAICFGCTHLCHEKPANRSAQLKQIKRIMRKQKENIKFVCGDLNSDTKENLVHPILKKWKDALPDDEGTFSSFNGKPHFKAYKYDYILYQGKVEVVQTMFRCNETLTDHCICIADLIIR